MTPPDTPPAEPAPDTPRASRRLKKKLGLLDVFAISTGAMFSSGFFLLPGVAAAGTGPSVFLAYLVASVLMLPAMFSMAELSTAMPRAGGAYYFLDRALGPLVGTIGGVGTWLALVLKSAFALIGMGAYLVLFLDLPIRPVAVALTVVFAAMNVLGAKETAGLQRGLVLTLIGIMAFYLVQGLSEVFGTPGGPTRVRDGNFFAFGAGGFLATVGTVFVSYAGLTKVASVSEEIENPDRNIPLGMTLSLLVTTTVYVLGVFLMVEILPAEDLRSDLTPVATAGDAFLDWLPPPAGMVLVVAAAIAAFASTGNAGILAASRYPLAMARDHLVPARFRQLGGRGTPVFSIVVTSALMILCILVLDVEKIAKFASAFQLLIFALLNLAVLVMRESRIQTYVPGYLSPLYPWMQIFGAVTALLLIRETGATAALFTGGMVAGCVAWYVFYARGRVEREGAIFHIFARLGRRRFEGLDFELREIMKERSLQDHDPYDELVTRARVLDVHEKLEYPEVVARASKALAEELPVSARELERMFLESAHIGGTPVSHGAALPDLRLSGVVRPELALVRLRHPIVVPLPDDVPRRAEQRPVTAVLLLVGSAADAGQHLRILAELVSRVDEDSFLDEWNAADSEAEIREVLLRHERFLALTLEAGTPTGVLIGRPLREVGPDLPHSALIALIQRGGEAIVPHGSNVLREGDRLTILGDPQDVRITRETYRTPRASTGARPAEIPA